MSKICLKIFHFWENFEIFFNLVKKRRNFDASLAKNVKNQVKIRQKFEIFAKIWPKNNENFEILAKFGKKSIGKLWSKRYITLARNRKHKFCSQFPLSGEILKI